MNNSQSTLWDIEPHTQAKHDILAYYLKAWFPILAQTQFTRRLLYVDGFAGPGEYTGGEPGSPVLALTVLLQHQLSARIIRPGNDLVFLFIERDERRFRHLQNKLTTFSVPENVHVHVVNDTFEHYLTERLAELEERGLSLAPSFIFIDPFGPTGFPMALVERITIYPRSEVLINFAYQSLNEWFLPDTSKHPRLNEIYGSDRWRPALNIVRPMDKEVFLVQEYRRALEEHGWRGLSFRMVNKHNQTQYHLMFGTKHPLGMLKMKGAMWNVAPDGNFQYSDFSDPGQLRLFTETMGDDYAQELAGLIWQNRRGSIVTKKELLDNETAYHPTTIEKHLTRALRVLEYETAPPRILAVTKSDGTSRRARTYPDGCAIQFAA
ncbi:MAG: three-Cys-motif partner protein TcmP [Chloroflexota bacterium]